VHGISLRRGLKTHCGCKRTYRLKETIEFPKEYINKTKTCSSCAKEKEYKDFYFKEYINPKGNKTYQFSARCIQCDIEAVQQERADNPEWIIGYNQQRYQDKKDDYFRPLLQKYKKENKDKYSEWARNWRKDNLEKVSQYNRQRKMHKNHNIKKDELNILYSYANDSCMYCGMTEEESQKEFGQKLHRDHAYNEGSNGIDNCILACKSCNTSKRDNDWDKWYTPDNPLYNEERYLKIKEWLDGFKS
jgi:hypothetical protein